MRIMVAHWGKSGGGPLFAGQLIDALNAEVGRVWTSLNSQADNLADYEIADRDMQTVRTYQSKIGVVLNLWRLAWNGYMVRRFIKLNGIQIVAVAMESIYQSLSLPFFVPRGVKYVLIVHDASEHPGEEHVLKRIGRRFELRRADSIIALSESVAAIVEKRTGRSVVQLFHPVAPPLTAVPRRLPYQKPVVGFFGRLLPYKGLPLLIGAVKTLRARGFEAQCQVWGDGPDRSLKAPNDGIDWHTGWLPGDKIAEVIGGFDLLVLPYTEASQSGVLPWAARLGVPTLVTDVGGLREQGDCLAALVADEPTSEALADAIERILTSSSEYILRSSQTLKAVDTMSWNRFAAEFTTLCGVGEVEP